MKSFKVLFVGGAVVLCSVLLSACSWFQGDPGIPGRDGSQGDPAIAIDVTILRDLYSEHQSEHENCECTYIEFVQEFYRNIGLITPGTAGVQYASNEALKSAVDIRVSISGKPMSGAGVIYKLEQDENGYTGNGYIITNYHVISKCFQQGSVTFASSVYVYLYGTANTSNGLPAHIVGGSVEHDIAVLRLEGTDDTQNYIRTVKEAIRDAASRSAIREVAVAEKHVPAVGSQIVAVGNPLGDDMSVTDGIVSVQSEYMEMVRLDTTYDDTGVFRVMRVSAAINPGNSGGGVFNMNGELVGIVQARRFWVVENEKEQQAQTDPVDNIAYAIPLDIALNIADQFIARADETAGGAILALKTWNTGGLAVKTVDSYSEFTDGEMVAVEVVSVRGRNYGNTGLSQGERIYTISVDRIVGGETVTKDYKITHDYHVEDIMIAAWDAAALRFNDPDAMNSFGYSDI